MPVQHVLECQAGQGSKSSWEGVEGTVGCGSERPRDRGAAGVLTTPAWGRAAGGAGSPWLTRLRQAQGSTGPGSRVRRVPGRLAGPSEPLWALVSAERVSVCTGPASLGTTCCRGERALCSASLCPQRERGTQERHRASPARRPGPCFCARRACLRAALTVRRHGPPSRGNLPGRTASLTSGCQWRLL